MSSSVYLPRKRPTQARSRATFDAILEAAAQLLEKRGYAGATTNRVAERAGVSIGSVYEYFPSKDAIFATLQEGLDSATFEYVFDQIANFTGRTPQLFVRAVLVARVEAALRQPKLEALLRAEIPDSVFAAQAEANFARFDEGMRAFAAGHSDVIRIENIEVAMMLGTNVVELTVRHLAASNPDHLRDPAVVDALVDMMSRWILKDAP